MQEYRLLKAESDGNKLRGLIATNAKSQNLGGFREIIDNRAFDESLRNNDNVICCVNHDPSQLLGRTSSGTLTLTKSSSGLVYSCDLPNTKLGRDVKELLSRGDLSQSSFGFVCTDDDWSQDSDGTPLRTVRNLSLKDVSCVTSPAYLQSTAELSRSIPVSCPAEYRYLLEQSNQSTSDDIMQRIALVKTQIQTDERTYDPDEIRARIARIQQEMRDSAIKDAEERERNNQFWK